VITRKLEELKHIYRNLNKVAFWCGVVMLVGGGFNLLMENWYGTMSGALAVFAAGYVIHGSFLVPIISRMAEKLNAPEVPEEVAKAIVERVCEELEELKKTGTIPTGLHISFGLDEGVHIAAGGEQPPKGRMN
jgi:hypothetical protein